MSNLSNQFPHKSLRLAKEGTASPPSGGGRRISDTTLANKSNAWGHGSKLKSSIDSITSHWQEEKEKRNEEDKPPLLDIVCFILQIDPDLFKADDLKSFGIEIVADLEQGYIIGASADTELSTLRKKIDQFINSERGGGKIPEIWEVLEGTKRPEYILSDTLQQEWENIAENQEIIVDVGISCIDIREQYSSFPERKESYDNKRYQKRVDKWLDKYNLSPEDLDDLYWTREQQLQKFIQAYKGEILDSIPFTDSFSCRIRIIGKGLKDLVLNFPYIFDVSEPDEFSSPIAISNEFESDKDGFYLESPSLNAPKVCVIDSGIQERHPKLQVAIDSAHSTSWIPGDENTSDYVRGGGHGTRVAGAILYPQGIPESGRQSAIC